MQNPNFKKLVVIAGVLGAILAAVLGFLFVSSSQNDLQINEKDVVVIPTVNPSKSVNFNTYNQGSAHFEYPETATIETGSVDGGGEAVILRPDVAVDPIIEIQITQASETPIDRIHKIFEKYGFVKQEILMGEGNAISATLYIGAISLPNGDLQEEVAVFENNGNVYKIQMSYTSDTVDPEASEAFQVVLSTFKI